MSLSVLVLPLLFLCQQSLSNVDRTYSVDGKADSNLAVQNTNLTSNNSETKTESSTIDSSKSNNSKKDQKKKPIGKTVYQAMAKSCPVASLTCPSGWTLAKNEKNCPHRCRPPAELLKGGGIIFSHQCEGMQITCSDGYKMVDVGQNCRKICVPTLLISGGAKSGQCMNLCMKDFNGQNDCTSEACIARKLSCAKDCGGDKIVEYVPEYTQCAEVTSCPTGQELVKNNGSCAFCRQVPIGADEVGRQPANLTPQGVK